MRSFVLLVQKSLQKAGYVTGLPHIVGKMAPSVVAVQCSLKLHDQKCDEPKLNTSQVCLATSSVGASRILHLCFLGTSGG